MNHCGTVRMETERLVLRPFRPEDAPDFYRNVTSDPEVNRFLTWKNDADVTETEELLKGFISRYEDPQRYCWAITVRETGEVIGTIAAPTVKNRTETVEVTYAIGKSWWGKEIAAEALRRGMDFFFEEVGVNRIEAGHDLNNPNSGRVMQKCGMRREGVLRQAGRNNRGLFDLVFYARLRSD